jgi:hypothetical protein
MPNPINDNAAWIEILEPLAPPPLFSTGQVLLCIGVLLAVLLLLLRWWRRQPRQRARAQLRVMLAHVDHPGRDLRQLGLQLRASLCLGLRVTNLQQHRVATPRQSDWQAYCAALTQLCYQPHAPTSNQLTVLIHQARDWLNTSPASHAR